MLIFTEIIEINACDLEKNTRKNIQLREEMEGDDDNNDTIENILPSDSTEENKVEFDGVEIDLNSNGKSSRSSSKASVSEKNDDEVSEKLIN